VNTNQYAKSVPFCSIVFRFPEKPKKRLIPLHFPHPQATRRSTYAGVNFTALATTNPLVPPVRITTAAVLPRLNEPRSSQPLLCSLAITVIVPLAVTISTGTLPAVGSNPAGIHSETS
jgi:hypothetical protein